MEEKMRIGFNGRPFCQDSLRGLGRHTLELIKHLHQLAPQVEIYVYSFDRVSEFYRKQLPFVKFRDQRRRPKIFWDLYHLGRDVKKDRLQLFHSTNNLGVPFHGKDLKVVTTIHDVFTHVARKKPVPTLRGLWDYFNYHIELFLYLRSDLFITVSEVARQTIIQELGLPKDKVKVAYNGTDFPEAKGTTEENYFLYVGGFEERKNLLPLLKAVELYNRGERVLTPLYLVGRVENIPAEVQEFLRKFPDLFILKGGVSDEELKGLYQRAKAFIFPSKDEGFGLPLVEAMRSGTPVVASSIPVFKEVGGDACLYFSPDDEKELLERLKDLEKSQVRQELQEKGRVRSKLFTWSAMTKTIIKTYAELGVSVKASGGP